MLGGRRAPASRKTPAGPSTRPHPGLIRWQGGRPMRILMATSFPIPGDYDGTAMLPIKILRALKARGVDVVHAHLQARPPLGRAVRGDFEGTPSFTLPPSRWITGLRRIAREFPFD